MGKKHFYGIFACLLVVFLTEAAWAGFTGVDSATLRSGSGSALTLAGGRIYTAKSDVTYFGSNGACGVELDQNAGSGYTVLYIPQGVTMSLKGADGGGLSAGRAGIRLRPGETLVVCGHGTLLANGGDGTAPVGGSRGGNADVDDDDVKLGDGGAGGRGGAGAAAGIGGNGGNAGSGGSTKTGSSWDYDGDYADVGCDGASGNSGSSGSNGEGMGVLWIVGDVKVTARRGEIFTDAGAAGEKGSADWYHNLGWRDLPIAGGGGGGGGGGSAGIADDIGSGAYGGGGGGSGGTGFSLVRDDKDDKDKSEYRNLSGHGGYGGRGYNNGSTGIEGTTSADQNTDSMDADLKTYYGGTGGSSGAGGSYGSSGSLYRYSGSTAIITMLSSSRAITDKTTAPDCIRYSVRLDNRSVVADSNREAVLSMPFPPISVPTSNGLIFKGYYTEPDGKGTRYYDETGEMAFPTYDLFGDLQLYAFWIDVAHLRANLVVNTTEDPETFDFGDNVVSLREAIAFAADSEDNVDAEGLRRVTFDPTVFAPGSSNVVWVKSQVTNVVGFTESKPLIIEGPTNAQVVVTGSVDTRNRFMQVKGTENCIRIRNLSFTGFRSPATTGDEANGGVFDLSNTEGRLELENCSFVANSAGIEGSVANVHLRGVVLEAKRCSFVGNSSANGIIQGRQTVEGCTFHANEATSGSCLLAATSGSSVRQNTFFGNSGSGLAACTYEAAVADGGNLCVDTPEFSGTSKPTYTATEVLQSATPTATVVDGVLQTYFPIKKNSPADGKGVRISGRTHDITGKALPLETDTPNAISLGSWNQDWEKASTVVTIAEDIVNDKDGETSFREAMATSAADSCWTNAVGERAVTFAQKLWDDVVANGDLVISCSNTSFSVPHLTSAPLVVQGPSSGTKGLVIEGTGANHSLFWVESTCGLRLSNMTLRGGYETWGAAIHARYKTSGALNFSVSNCLFTANSSTDRNSGVVYGRGDIYNCSFKDNNVSTQGRDFYVYGIVVESTMLGSRPSCIYAGSVMFALGCTAPAGLEVSSERIYGCATAELAEELNRYPLKEYRVGTVPQYAYQTRLNSPFAGKGCFFWHSADMSSFAYSKLIDGRDKVPINGSVSNATMLYDVDITGRRISAAAGDNRNSIGSYAVPAERASLVVDSLDDDDGEVNFNDGPVTLRDAIVYAHDRQILKNSNGPGYRITFADDLYTELAHGLTLPVPKTYPVNGANFTEATPLTIEGVDNPDYRARLDQFTSDRIFSVTDNAVLSLVHLAFMGRGEAVRLAADDVLKDSGTNAKSSDGAFAQLSSGGRLKMDDCQVSGFLGETEGAVHLKADAGSASFTQTVFHENYAASRGGAVSSAGVPLVFEDCRFDGNGSGKEGGAIYTTGDLLLDGCTLSGNKTKNYGGGIRVSQTSGVSPIVTLANCTIIDNVANIIGGGVNVDAEKADVAFVNCTLRGNEAHDADGGGGGADLHCEKLTLLNSLLTGNLPATDAVADLRLYKPETLKTFKGYGSMVLKTNYPDLIEQNTSANVSFFVGSAYAAIEKVFAYSTAQRKDERLLNGPVEQNFERLKQSYSYVQKAFPVKHSANWHAIRAVIGGGEVNLRETTETSVLLPLTTDISGRDLSDRLPWMGSFWMDADRPSLVVTTYEDIVDPYDAKISLREAVDFAQKEPDRWLLVDENGDFIVTFTNTLKSGCVELARAQIEVTNIVENGLVVRGPTDFDVGVDGQGLWRAFRVRPGNRLQLENLTFTNCVGSSYGASPQPGRDGGAVLNTGVLYVSNCVFAVDAAGPNYLAPTAYGGAICTGQPDLTNRSWTVVQDCAFRDCRAARGGALYLYPSRQAMLPPYTLYTNRLDVINCVFDSNAAVDSGILSAEGGAVFIQKTRSYEASAFSIEGTDLINNTVLADGSPSNVVNWNGADMPGFFAYAYVNGKWTRTLTGFAVPTMTLEGTDLSGDEVKVTPGNIVPNCWYGLGWKKRLQDFDFTVDTWVKSDEFGVLPEPLTAPKDGTSGFYRVLVTAEDPTEEDIL